jgi:hypothetical protein
MSYCNDHNTNNCACTHFKKQTAALIKANEDNARSIIKAIEDNKAAEPKKNLFLHFTVIASTIFLTSAVVIFARLVS